MGDLTDDVKGALLMIMRHELHSEKLIDTSNYLRPYIRLHLTDWIESAIRARYMLEGDNYVIDINRTETNQAGNVNIVIMDTDTGTEQYNSQWSNGLHQFLQMKHGCRITYETLKAVFMSNITFFKQYQGRIYGLTGTLGSASERKLLQDLYDIEFFNIPTFRPTQFTEEPAIVCNTEEHWRRTVVSHVRKVAQNRPVLVICDTVRNVEKLSKYFSDVSSLKVYIHSYQELNFWKTDKKDVLDEACIILATNLAGRGTDIKIHKRLESLGGLHVCLTYLPKSCRVEMQAFGRAARKGDRGSGKLITLGDPELGDTEDPCRIYKLRIDRNRQEAEATSSLIAHYRETIVREEKLFSGFTDLFRSMKTKLQKNKKIKKDQEDIILQSVLDRWALCLDKDSKYPHFETGDVDDIQEKVNITSVDDFVNNWMGHIECPVKLCRLGKLHSIKKDYKTAIELFDKVIASEPHFAEAAHYYKAFCVIRKSSDRQKSVIFSSLYRAERLIKKRKETMSFMAAIVDQICSMYRGNRHSFIILADYKKQKQDRIEIYEQYMASISVIIGKNLSLSLLQSFTRGCAFLEGPLFQMLDDILTCPKVALGYEDRLTFLDTKYDRYRDKIDSKMLHLKDRDYVTANDFIGIYPSQEELWENLEKMEAIVEKLEVVIVDEQTIKGLNQSKYDELMEDIRKLPRSDLMPMNHEFDLDANSNAYFNFELTSINGPTSSYLDDKYLVIGIDAWNELFGDTQMTEALMHSGYIWIMKQGKVNSDIANKTNFTAFDSFDRYYKQFNSKDTNMSDLLTLLQNTGTLSKDDPPKLLEKNLAKVPFLPGYERFYKDILDLLYTSFAYRIAIEELRETGRTSLLNASQLYNDLMELNVLQNYKFKEDDDIPSRINAIFDTVWTTNQTVPKVDECRLLEVKYPFNAVISEDHFKHLFGTTLRQQPQQVSQDFVENLWNEVVKMGWVTRVEESKLAKLNVLTKKIQTYTINPDGIKSKMTMLVDESESEYQLLGDPRYRGWFLYTKTVLLSYMSDDIDIIKTGFVDARSRIAEHDIIDGRLVCLDDCFDSDTQFRRLDELDLFRQNGFDHIIGLREKKWSWKSVAKIIAIGAVSIAQITAGVLVEIYTMGIGTYVASGLLIEGVGDLMFAAQCAISGHCSLKSYMTHKVVSLAMTASMIGVGAILTSGIKVSKFGVIFSDNIRDLSQKSGTSLIQAVGGRHIAIAAGKQIALTIGQGAAFGVANGFVDRAVEVGLNDHCEKISSDMLNGFNADFDKRQFHTTLEHLYDSVGPVQAQQIVDKITDTVFVADQNLNNISHLALGSTKGVVQGVLKGMTEAADKLNVSHQQSGIGLGFLSKIISASLTATGAIAGLAAGVHKLRKMSDKTLDKLQSELDAERERSIKISDSDTEIGDVEKFSSKACQAWKKKLSDKLTDTLKSYFKIVTNAAVNAAMWEAGKALQYGVTKIAKSASANAYRQSKSQQIKQGNVMEITFDQSVSTDSVPVEEHLSSLYQQKVLSISIRSNNQRLLDGFQKQNIHISPQDAQAVANLTRRKVTLTDNTQCVTKHFVPTNGKAEQSPIQLTVKSGWLAKIQIAA